MAEFGTPETWNMKVGNFIESELPKEKPQELLDLQEQNRKQRLLESLQKIGPRLEDSSLDFINRENFAEGTPEELEELRKVLDELKGKYPGLQLSIPIDKRKENFIPRIRINTEAQYRNLLEGKKRSFSIDEVDKLKKLLPKYAKVFAPKIEKSLKQKEKMLQEKRREFGVRGKYGDREKVVSELNQIVNEISEGKRPIFDLKRLRDGELIDTKLSPKHFLTVDDRTGKPKYLSKNNFNFLKKISNKDLSVIARAREAKVSPKMLQQIKNLTVKNYDEFVKQFPSRTKGVPSNIGQKIMDSLFRHTQTGGEKFEFISGDNIENYKIKDLSKGDTLTADRVNKLIQEKDPRFKEFKKVQDQVNKLKKTKYINPVSKEETTLFRALQKSTGDIFPIHIDHIKGVRDEPLKFLQPLLSKTNLGKSAANTVEELKKIGARRVLPGKKYAQGAVIDFEKQVEDLKKFADRKILQTEASGFVKPKTPKELLSGNNMKNIAKKLASFGFKCSAAEGGACDNPMAYLDDIKKQQAIAKGSGNAAANAAKKLSAGKTIMREFIGPAALGFELAAAVPITYLGYKAGLPPARIVADATYGLFGDTEKARLKKEAVKAGIDTTEIQKSLDFEKASQAMQTLAQQEDDFRGPDDEMLFPQQYEKGEEDFYKAVGAFRDKAGNISKDVYQKFGSQLQQLRDYIAQTDAATAAERSSRVADFGGIDEFLNYNSGGRVGFADGPDNPKRRQFMKIMAGIASLPIVGKFFKGAKTAKVVKLANTTTKMPDWFPAFVDNAFKKGIAKKIDADLTEIEIPELPDVKVRAHDDGRIQVEGKNAYNEEYYIDYEPPGYVVVDETTGKAVKKPGDFVATDTEYRMISPEDYDIDGVNVDQIDDILGGSSTKLEGFAKGTNKEKYTIGQKRIDEADARGASKDESLRADINDPYGDIDPTDFTDD